MDVDISQDSFAFSDIVPPSHVSDLESFSDLEFSDTDLDSSLTESLRSHARDGTEEQNDQDSLTAQDNRQSKEKDGESFARGLQGLNDENIKEFLAAIEKTKAELDLGSSSRGSVPLQATSSSNLDESSLGILTIESLQDLVGGEQLEAEPEANNRTLIGNDGEISINAVDSSDDDEDFQFLTEPNEKNYHMETMSQRGRTLEARPDTGRNPDEFFNPSKCDQESSQELPYRDDSLGFNNNSEELNMMLLARSGSADGGELIDRVSLTSTISFIQSQTFPDSIFSQSLSSTSRGLGSGMDSGSESDTVADHVAGLPVAHTSGDGSNGSDTHSRLAVSRQAPGGDGGSGGGSNQHLTVVRPGLEGGNSEAEDDGVQNTQAPGIGMETVPGSLGLRQSAEGGDVMPDIPGDGGGGGDGSSGSDSEDNAGPAGAAYASSSSSTVPSRTPSQGAHSNDFLHQLGLAAPWHGTVGVSPHQGDGQHASGGDRQQPVGHGAGDVSTPVPGNIMNNRQFSGLGDISARSLGLFEFQAASTPIVRQQGGEATDDTTPITSEHSALGAQYLLASNTPHSGSSFSSVGTPVWAQNTGSFQFSQVICPNQEGSGQNLTLSGVPSLIFEPTAIGQTVTPHHQDDDQTLVASGSTVPRARSGPSDHFLGGSFLGANNEDSQLWKSTPREEELSRLTPGVVFKGDTKPSPVMEGQEWDRQVVSSTAADDWNATLKSVAVVRPDVQSTAFSMENIWQNATDVSSGFASSGDFSSLLNRLAIEVPPADRTLTPGRASVPGLPFQNQSSSNPFVAISDRDWQNQGEHTEETFGNGRNPFDSEVEGFVWGRDDGIADYSDFAVQGNAAAILAADEEKFQEEHQFDHVLSPPAADISMGHNWTIPDESQYVMRRSLPVIGVNDPNDKGEVRISFGAFLAAGSEELGDLTCKDPDRPRPHFGHDMPISTPPPQTPYEAYAPTPVPDISPTCLFQGQSPPDPHREGPSIHESPSVLASQRQTPVTVKKQPKLSGKQVVHDPHGREGQLRGDGDRERKEGRNHGAPAHYQGQDQRAFEAYKSSLDEQYKRDLHRCRRSSRESSRTSSSKSSSHASVQSVISNKENGSQQKQGSTERERRPSDDRNQRDKKHRHSERSHTKRTVSKEDSRTRRNNAISVPTNTSNSALQSGFTMPKQIAALHETLQDQVDVSSNVEFDSGLPRTASSSLTSLLSSSTDISTMSHYEVAVLIANAVDADPEEISKMLISAAKAKTKLKSRTLPSKQGEAEHQLAEEKSGFRNTSSNGRTFAEGRKITNETARTQNVNTQPLPFERQPVTSGTDVGVSPSSSQTSPFKPSSTSSPHFSFSSEGNPQSLSNTAFSSPTEIHNRNTQPELSSYNLTNSSLVFSHDTPEDVHSARKTQYSKPTMVSSAAAETVELVPKFGKTYTIRELPAADAAVCERKQRVHNVPLNAELNVLHLQGNMSAVSDASPASISLNRSLTKQELGLGRDDAHTAQNENNKQFLPRDQTDAADYNRPSTNVGVVENDKGYTVQARKRRSQGDMQVKGLQPEVDISYRTAVSRAYNMQHVNPSPNTQMPNQGFPFQGTQQLYVNTNPSPLGMPIAQQPPYPVNNYPDHVMIPGVHQFPTPIGPVAMPQFPPHLYGPGNLPLGATVPQMPNYNLVGGMPFQHPSVQTVSAGIGPRTSSLVTAFSHAVNAVGTPPFIQTAPPGLLQTELQQGHLAGGSELVSARTASLTSVIVPEGATFPAVCCARVSTPSVFPLHNSSGRWMQCEVKVVLCTFNNVQVPNTDEGPFIIQPKIIIAPYSTENVKIKFEPWNAGVYSAQIQVFPSPVVPEAQTGVKPMEPCFISMEIVAEEPKVAILPEDSRVLEFGEMVGGNKQSRPLRLVNHGRASVPVRIIISANAASLHCFSFANADSSPRRSSTIPSKALSNSGAGLCIQTLTLMGQVDLNAKVEPTVVWLLFQAPSQGKGSTAGPVGPPDRFSARVDVEIDSTGQGPTVGSILLKANVGIVRLHTPHSLQAISLSGTVGQRVSRALPLRNAGNITFQAELKVIRDPEYFNISPDRVILKPGQETEVHVHFRATKPNVVVDSSLSMMVLPDGPIYEMILRGSSTSDKQAQQESDILMCNKPVVCWGGVGIGRAVQQKVIIRNQSKTPSRILQLQLSIQGNHSDFQMVSSFGSSDEKTSTHVVKLPSQEELVVHLLFAPSSMGLISSALVIRTPTTGTKSKVPLYGCGGTSHLVIVDAKKPTERSDYLADIGEVSLGSTNVTKLTIRNTGTRAAFVKAICYSDMQSRALYPATHLSIAPNDFVIPERSSKQVVIIYQPMEKDALRCRQQVSTVATIAFYTGDENIRAQYKRHIKQQAKPYSEVAVTGSLTGINFLTAFQGEDKLFEDAVYPQVANWDQFFQSCVTRMLLLLVGLPPQSARQDIPQPVNELPMPDTAVPPTPARKLPADARPSITRNGNTELWAVIPEHVVLTAPRSGSEKGTGRLQLLNFSERALGFEFIWPAHSLVLTPDRGQIPPRSQVMVIMSTKPSLALSGIDLPWGGTVYVQCDGTKKAVRVQIREDLVLDNSPYQPGSNALQSLSPNTALVTPYNPPLPTSHLPSLRVDPKIISFDETQTGKTAASAISLTNDGTAVLKWNMSSVAPAYVKAQDNTGDIFRTTYSVFHIARHSGTLAPGDTVRVAARFQPRDAGVYSQHWDIRAKDEDSKQLVKAKIELTGQAVKKLLSSDGVQLNDTLPLHQPPSNDTRTAQRATANTSRKAIKHPSGVYFENETLEFPDTAVGQTSEMRMKLCNNSDESQLVKLIDPKLPFSIIHHKVKLGPHRFVRVPVKFTPSKPSESFKSQLIVNTDKGQKLLIQLVGSSGFQI